MSDDKQSKITVPPPGGASDPYDAATVVGEASADILALVRAVEGLDSAAPPPGEPTKAAKATAKEEPKKVEPVKPKSDPDPPTHKETPRAKSEPPPRKPAASPAARSEPPRAAPAAAASSPPAPASAKGTGGGLPPGVSIPFFFFLVAAVLALVVR